MPKVNHTHNQSLERDMRISMNKIKIITKMFLIVLSFIVFGVLGYGSIFLLNMVPQEVYIAIAKGISTWLEGILIIVIWMGGTFLVVMTLFDEDK